MAEQLPLNSNQVRFLRGRYTRMLEQFLPVAYQHYQGVNSPQLHAAIEELHIHSDAIFNIFAVFLDDGRYHPDEIETQQLVFVLLAMSQYLSQRGLWAQSLRWGSKLLDQAESQGWTFDPALLTHLSKAHLEASDPLTTLHFLSHALESPLLVENPKVEALLFVGLSSVQFRTGQYEESIRSALRATQVPLPTPEPALQTDAWINVFNALIALGQYEKSLQAAKTAHQNALIMGQEDLLRLASTTIILALAYTANGHYEEAPALYETGISFYNNIGDEPNTARAQFMYAVHAYRVDQRTLATELVRASLLTYERYEMVAELRDAQKLLNQLT